MTLDAWISQMNIIFSDIIGYFSDLTDILLQYWQFHIILFILFMSFLLPAFINLIISLFGSEIPPIHTERYFNVSSSLANEISYHKQKARSTNREYVPTVKDKVEQKAWVKSKARKKLDNKLKKFS